MASNPAVQEDVRTAAFDELSSIAHLIGLEEYKRRTNLIKLLSVPMLSVSRPFLSDPDFQDGHILSVLNDLIREINDIDDPYRLVTRESVERTARIHEECVAMRKDGRFPKKIGFGTDALHRMILLVTFLSSVEDAETLRSNLAVVIALAEDRPMTYRLLMGLIPQLDGSSPLMNGII